MSWSCDFCVSADPTTRYDLPPGTTMIETLDKATGKRTRIVNAGQIGACDACAKILASKVMPGKRLAQRMLHHPKLSHLKGKTRRDALAYMERRFTKIAATASNPRPCVKGDDPMDGREVWVEPNKLNPEAN